MIGLSRRATAVLTILYALVLIALSVLPSGKDTLGGWDQGISPALQNVLHVPAYALLVWLASMALRPQQSLGTGRILSIAAMCCVFGLALEFAQVWIPGRGGSVTDALLNVVGAVAGAGFTMAWQFHSHDGRRATVDHAAAAGKERDV